MQDVLQLEEVTVGLRDMELRTPDLIYELVSDFKAKRDQPRWPLVSKAVIRRLWSDFTCYGRVQDDAALDGVFATMRDNVIRLKVVNELANYPESDPNMLRAFDSLITTQELAHFMRWLAQSESAQYIEPNDLESLQYVMAKAAGSQCSQARLKHLDHALHLSHSNQDLAYVFVEGGRGTVDSMSVVSQATQEKAHAIGRP